jgi:ribosomal subunit interface protein
MTIQITGRNLDIGDALRDYATGRLQDILLKYVGKSYPGHIRIEKVRSQFATNCSIDLWSGLRLHARAESENPHASVDQALERLDKQLRRYKRRLSDHFANNSAHPAAEISATDYTVRQAEEDEETHGNGADHPVIVAERPTVVRELPVSDAVMELDLADRSFLLFKNASHGRINIVYRREDGNIGWIDPGTLS